jgi:2-octaprenyl-6-methoxyphenol hydroxylase
MTALQLAQSGHLSSVEIFDPSPVAAGEVDALDVRSTALSAGTLDELARLGISTEQLAAQPISGIHVSASQHFGGLVLSAQEIDRPYFGAVVENQKLLNALSRRIEAQPNIQASRHEAICRFTVTEHGVQLKTSSDDVQQAELLVIADGANSRLLQQAGIDVETTDYQQVALVFNVALKQPHQGIARERFADGKPLALLPLTQQRYAAVWCVASEDAAALMALSPELFIERFEAAATLRFGGVEAIGEIASFPVAARRSQEIFRRGIAVIGNAAHALHPVAGQGFNLCARDGARLAAAMNNFDWQRAYSALATWEQMVQQDQDLVFSACDRLVRTFGLSSRLAAIARTSAMITLASTPALRKEFLSRAAGLHSTQQGALI